MATSEGHLKISDVDASDRRLAEWRA